MPATDQTAATIHRRAMRACQQRRRGGRVQYQTVAENLEILLAWQAAELSEGQVAKALGLDRVACRAMMQDAVARGTALGHALWLRNRKEAYNARH